MGKRISVGVSDIVTALCADFDRRARAIKDASVSHRTEMEFRYINYKMIDAASEIAGEEYAGLYIKEIGRHIGYARSKCENISESVYKLMKQEVMINIAKKLHLID